MKLAVFPLLLRLQPKKKPFPEGGLTLIESIVAMVISTVILTSLAPPLLFSAATRVQSRKVEQAQGIARGELDRVRAALSREQGISQNNEVGNIPPASNTTPLVDTAAPNNLVQSRSDLTTPDNALEVDVDGDGENDFFVQLIRNEGVRFDAGGSSGQLAAFRMGIRVYDHFAADNLGSLNTDPASLQMTQGIAQRATNPLAVTYVDVYRSDLNLSLQETREYVCQVQPSLSACQP